MYDYIKGEITAKVSNPKGNFLTVEAFGIGYSLEVTTRDFKSLSENSDVVKVYTVLLHREDKMSLCGFLRREERDIFNVLTSVSGVGAKMALALLDEFESSELIGFVLDEDFRAITRAKGVGPKLAQKIILELKDKLVNFKSKAPIKVSALKVEQTQSMDEAQMVLQSFGYKDDEIERALCGVASVCANGSTEEILKEALRLLSL